MINRGNAIATIGHTENIYWTYSLSICGRVNNTSSMSSLSYQNSNLKKNISAFLILYLLIKFSYIHTPNIFYLKSHFKK